MNATLTSGVWPWDLPLEGAELVLSYGLGVQYLSGLLIGMGVGGVVGASTLGVAMFSLIAPTGHLKDFTAMVPVVNVCANLATVSVYFKSADWRFCMRMWPFIVLGIGIGQLIFPLIEEAYLRRLTSIVYGTVLLQQFHEKAMEIRAAKAKKVDSDDKAGEADELTKQKAEFYNKMWVTASVSILCGIITVVTNNSGPIFNIYLLSCGLSMDQFVASRGVMMAGKNVTKVVARMVAGGLSWKVAIHGMQVGLLTIFGVQIAKPIKKHTSPELYKYFTWCVLIYTTVKMWMQ